MVFAQTYLSTVRFCLLVQNIGIAIIDLVLTNKRILKLKING